ncbi:MAG: hypothetical protein ACE5HC_01195 [Candidatus Binatia bacterium]
MNSKLLEFFGYLLVTPQNREPGSQIRKGGVSSFIVHGTMKRCYCLRLGLATLLLLVGCVTTGAPELRNLETVAEVYEETIPSGVTTESGKLIYIGVYGGELPSWPEAEGFDPQHWSGYRKINPYSDGDLSDVAFHQSNLNVIGLRIGRQFPNSVTFVIRGDSTVVAGTVQRFYTPGDRVYLAGFSNGGAAVVDAAYILKQQNIPVQMTAQVDAIGTRDLIPRNVTRAFNFYSLNDLFCRGKRKMSAEDPNSTQVTNKPIPDPQGPFTWGFCTVHRNMDSDRRVWKPIVDYIIKSESVQERLRGSIKIRQKKAKKTDDEVHPL